MLSLNVPVAVNCCVRPFAMDGFGGRHRDRLQRRRRHRQHVVEPVTPLSVAVIVVVPAATPLASPPGT